MNKIKVLIVDDSIIYRSVLKATFQRFDFIEVVGVASNGRIAIEKLKVLAVDLVILDIEMPELDGLGTLKEMAKLSLHPKVILFSSLTSVGATVTLEGLKLSASDFVTKPDHNSSGGKPEEKIERLLIPKMKALFNIDPTRPIKRMESSAQMSSSLWQLYSPKIVLIGSSTGGPAVLEDILKDLRSPLKCPIVIVQHMPPLFTQSLAERLSRLTGIECREAINGEKVENRIYVAPGDFHLSITGDRDEAYFKLTQDEQVNFVRPAVDVLFNSAAGIYQQGCLAFVLTGMGQDGKNGCVNIKKNNGVVIIQEEKSCAVFGMPGAVMYEGCFDFIKEPNEIASVLKEKCLGMI